MGKEHINIWAENIDRSRKFYTLFFAGKAKRNAKERVDQLDSYCISFRNGPSLEINSKTRVTSIPESADLMHPVNDIAFRFQKKSQVDDLTQWVIDEGFKLEKRPHEVEQGTYSSIVRDPDNNRVEIYHLVD